MKDRSLRSPAWALGYLLGIHLVALLLFFIFRWVLFVGMEYEFTEPIRSDWGLQAVAFVKGVWFDNVVCCYILTLPLLLLWIGALCNRMGRWLWRFTALWFILLYGLCFVISAANIPYFAYFFKVINSSIYNWFGYVGTTAGMIFGERSYYFPILLGTGALLFWSRFVWRFAARCHARSAALRRPMGWASRLTLLVVGALLMGLCVFGIRGRMGYNPIKVSQAYYCEDPFLNQLGLNPAFNLLISTMDDARKENRKLQLMDDAEAVAQAQRLLARTGIEGISPLARVVRNTPETPATATSADAFLPATAVATLPERVIPTVQTDRRPNVVMLFMESMSYDLLGARVNGRSLTPTLDSLVGRSISLEQCYSAGIHTNHGLYSTLYSFPTIMKRNAMKGSVIPRYSGLPTVLRDEGYRNLFFMTHESQYDNMNAFFRTNGFDEIYAEEDYPKEKIANHFGVADDYLYEYALGVLDERARDESPFFAALLSISNHPPYVIPESFTPHSDRIEDQIVEYADHSIGELLREAATRPWYDNTIFVLLGDHGKKVGTPECEMPVSYNHIPCLIFGAGIEPMRYEGFCGQIDLAPTLLGLLGVEYTQHNFGIDLGRERRSCIFYTADNLIAARDAEYLYIHEPKTGQEFCYAIEADRLRPLTAPRADSSAVPSAEHLRLEALRNHCFVMLQSTEALVGQGMITTFSTAADGASKPI